MVRSTNSSKNNAKSGTTTMVMTTGGGDDADRFNYEHLKLIEKPTSARNSHDHPQTLEGAEGYLRRLPLRPPNADQNVAKTITDMINILTDPDAVATFAKATSKTPAMVVEEQQGSGGGATPYASTAESTGTHRAEGSPALVYSYAKSPVMKIELKKAAERTCHRPAFGLLGHIVDPGMISLYKKDGKTYAVSEGRWFLMSYKAHWTHKNLSLDQDVIAPVNSRVLIIRVPPGSCGRILDNGVPYLLDCGTHIFNSGTIQNCGTVTYAGTEYISHGRYHYVRVPRGRLALVWAEVMGDNGLKSVVPRVLQEGEHCCDSHLFRVDRFEDVSKSYIHHGSIHLIAVEKGYVAKVIHDNTPRLLGEGDHVIESTNFEHKGVENLISTNVIMHGTISVLRVTLGQVALAWQSSSPVFLDKPGLYEFDTPNFSFDSFKDAEEQVIQLGAKKILICNEGEVAVTFDQGELKILKSGRHVIDSAVHVFHRFLSTQQKSIRLTTYSASEKARRMTKARASAVGKSRGASGSSSGTYQTSHPSSASSSYASQATTTNLDMTEQDLTVCETKDLVKVGLRADVFYSIENPELCIQKIDVDELEDLIRETAVATLTNIVRSTALNEIATSKSVSADAGGSRVNVLQPPTADGGGQQAGPSPTVQFFTLIHDEFMAKLHDDFLNRYGVDVANIRVESFKIMDEALAEQISKHALTTAQIENQMANLEGKSLISTTEERTAAEVKCIHIDADAAAKKTAADAENQRKIDAAKAEAESLKIATLAKAQAESESILMKARSEAEAIRLRASAEAERANLLSQTTLGQQEALLGQYSNMVIESNRGVEKVVYLDPSVNRESPFALGSLQNLNNDLHCLSQMGLAASTAVTTSGNGKKM